MIIFSTNCVGTIRYLYSENVSQLFTLHIKVKSNVTSKNIRLLEENIEFFL